MRRIHLAALVMCGACAVSAGDLSQVVMRLERHQSWGSQSYLVEVHGDGSVRYVGKDAVLIEATLHWKIPRADAAALLEAFRKSGYLELKDKYLFAYDSEMDTSELESANVRKSVFSSGSTCAPESSTDQCVPARLRALYDEIDKVSGATSVIAGDERTLSLLEQAGFDFRSSAAATALVFALHELKTALAGELVTRGAPLTGGNWTSNFGETRHPPAIQAVPVTGDLKFAKMLIAKGALAQTEARRLFLLTSVMLGNAPMTELALEHYKDVRKNSPEDPWVVAAAHARLDSDDRDEPQRARDFDPRAVLRLLIAAGANPKAMDDAGNSALHFVADAPGARILLDAGADPNAANKEGKTPLFGRHDPKLVHVLVQAGADVNARRSDGRSALESALSFESARALIRAGASLPKDPEALEKLSRLAAENEAETVR